MRRTNRSGTTNQTGRETSRQKTRPTLRLAAAALAVSATLTGANALADHKGIKQQAYNYHGKGAVHHGPVSWNQQVRVRIPVRDNGPETLPLGRLIRQNSNVDLTRYRLLAVETTNGRFSNGYASLRTGKATTQRYFLGSRAVTRIPAPSHADNTWHLRLGPGTQVQSLTAVLAPMHRSNYRPASINGHHQQATHGAPLLGLAWLLASADDDDRHHDRDRDRDRDWDRKQEKRIKQLRTEQARTESKLAATKRKLDRTREQNKQLKDQRARLAEQRAHDRAESRPGKQGSADRKNDRQQVSKKSEKKSSQKSTRSKAHSEREVKRTVRYVVSAH